MKSFDETYNGYLQGLLRWEQWNGLCERMGAGGESWYVYAVGGALPEQPVSGPDLRLVLEEIDALLRRDHEEEYLGIVYTDDADAPTLVKIYDPNHLGSSCGSSGRKVPPGWVVSRQPPFPIATEAPLPNNRRRWWQGLLERLAPGSTRTAP